MAIRYTNKTKLNIQRVLRNYNQKIKRLEKLNKDVELPERLNFTQLKSEVKTRRELNRKLNQLRRYSKRGIEETITTKGGVTTSKYNIENVKRENIRIKKALTREIHYMEQTNPTIGGIEVATSFASMGDPQYNELLAKRETLEEPIENLTEEQFKNREKLLSKISREQDYINENFKATYLEMLNELGYFYEYDSSKLEHIAERIGTLPRNKFDKLFKEEQAVKDIIYHYLRMFQGINIKNWEAAKEEVWNLYDILYDNLDLIMLKYE